MKATEQYFLVVLFIILYKVVLTFESKDEILKCDYSNDSYCLSSTFKFCSFSILNKTNFRVIFPVLACAHFNV